MLKVRIMGTKRDMKWFRRKIERNKSLRLLSCSEPFAIKGSNRYYRMYFEIERNYRKSL